MRAGQAGGWLRLLRGVVLGVVAVTALLVLSPAPTAEAHSSLLSSSPVDGAVAARSLDTAALRFDENVRPVPSGFLLYDARGNRQPLSVSARDNVVQVSLPPELSPGSYVLSWRVIATDSHALSGALTFAVGYRSGSPLAFVSADEGAAVSVVYAAAQVAGYLGLMLSVGLTAFQVGVVRSGGAGRRTRRVLAGAALTAVTADALLVPLTLVRQEGGPLRRLLEAATWTGGWRSPAGLTLALVAVGCSVLLGASVMSAGRRQVVAAVVGAGLTLSSVLPVGHTRTYSPAWLVGSADVVHVAAAAVWIGGVVGLAGYLTQLDRSVDEPLPAAQVVARFSALAGLLVAAVGVTGTALAVIIVGSPQALVTTGYGRTFLVKLVLVAVVGLLAVWNRLYLLPAVRRQLSSAAGWRRLRAAIRDEASLLVVVICVTGLLVGQNPAPQPGPGTLQTQAATTQPVASFTADLDGSRLRGHITPGLAGRNTVEFDLRTEDDQPFAPVGLPRLSASLRQARLGPIDGTVERYGEAGHYRALIMLPLRGEWQITVSARVSRYRQPTCSASVTIS